jgi:hypothetical protein
VGLAVAGCVDTGWVGRWMSERVGFSCISLWRISGLLGGSVWV